MSIGLIKPLRAAVLTHLKGDAAVTAIIPAARLYPSTTPANVSWPFGRFDGPQSIPLDGGCYAGSTISFFYHGFAKGTANVETAEDEAMRIAAAFEHSLHNRRLEITSPATTARISVLSARIIMDGAEQSAWHAIVSCSARIFA